jgi:bla regulator protein BlaR1
MSDHIIKALCNTLLHSLWQGIILAVVTGAIIIFTKRSSAAFRYNSLVGALTLFALGVTVTFIGQLQKPAAKSTSYYSTGSPTGIIQASAAHATSTPPPPATAAAPIAQRTGTGMITEKVIGFFNTHYTTIVLIWFLIICAKSVQMAVGLRSVSHLKRTNVSRVGEDWENRLLLLAEQLNIQQAIRLMESGIAKVPMVVGHLKPVILIPIGLINSLTATEVEAILIHELAHIRRRDYLVNLLQSLMEIVFFFNPAVLWISQLIRTERENCCDDLTIAQSRNKESYIRAMVSCEEYKAGGAAGAAGAGYAMAFPGAKNTLLFRVTRIVHNRNYSLSLFEKTILAVCLVVTGLGISAFTARENVNRENVNREKISRENPKKVLPFVAPVIHPEAKAGHIEKPKTVNNDSTRFRHPAFALPAKPDTNKRTIFDTTRAIARELYREQLLVDTDQLNIRLNDRELIVNGVRMPQEVYERIYRQFGAGGNYVYSLSLLYESKHPGPYDAFLKQRFEEIAAELLRDNLVNDRNYFTYKLSRDELLIDGVRQPDELRRRIVDNYFKPGDDFNFNYTYRNPGSYEEQKNYVSDAYRYRNPDVSYQQMGEERKRLQAETDKKLVADLLQDGLITDPKDVSFTLNDKEVIVNGKKQSDAIYRKYKGKYIPADAGSGWSWTYSHHE